MAEETTSNNPEPKGLLISADDLPDWGNDGVLLETQEQKDAAKAAEEEEAAKKKADENPEPEVEEPEEDAVEVEYVEDPGPYQPQDYSFEVTTYDAEGNKPKNHKISTVEEWDALMEGDPNFGSAVALSKAMRLANKMEVNLERDVKDWQKKKDDYEAVSAADKQQAEQLTIWEKEMQYLVNRGDLPKITKAQADADWNDPEVAKQDGVKEQVALLKFMNKENKARTKAGLKPLTSMIDAFNAFNAFQADEVKKGKPSEPAKPTTGEIRKAAGARVASGSSTPSAGAPKGIAVGRGGSLDDLGASWWS